MKDGAVVVLYNPKNSDYNNILDYANKVDITLIIDNSAVSHLNEVEKYIEVDDEHIIYWHFFDNPGLCVGMNRGLKYLKEMGCEWALAMNSDSSFNTDIIFIFREYIRRYDTSKVAILSPQFNFNRHHVKYYKGVRERKWVMMSGNFMNLALFEKLDGFLEELFVDGLDVEYCLWARKHRYKIMECGEAILNHVPGNTFNVKLFGKCIFRVGIDSPKRYSYQARGLA